MRLTLGVGARVHAFDPYWPGVGRPVQKERIVEGAAPGRDDYLGRATYRWTDPKNHRPRWVLTTDAFVRVSE